MTNEEIKQQAEEYAKQHKMRTDFGCWWPEAYDTKQQAEAYITGAHSRDKEIEELARTPNKWIKCSEQLPKKYDGRIRSNTVLASITGDDWTVAEYHFGDKQWINLLEIKVIEPKYWQEVNLPEEELEK